MYEGVRVSKDGPTTPGRFALTVSRVGFDGAVFRKEPSDPVTVDSDTLSNRYGIDVVRGIEIPATKRSSVSEAIGNRRPEAEVLLVRGRDPDMNRFIAETPRVDVLADPMGGEGNVNHVIAEAAASNDVALEVDLSGVLRETGNRRVRRIAALRKLKDLIDDAGTPYVISAAPRTHLQVRGPRELQAVGEQIGFSRDEIRSGLQTWKEIAERTRKRRDPTTIVPGVTLEDPEEN